MADTKTLKPKPNISKLSTSLVAAVFPNLKVQKSLPMHAFFNSTHNKFNPTVNQLIDSRLSAMLNAEHLDMCNQNNISIAGYTAGYFRLILARLFILFPAAAGHFMQSEADADSLGLINGLNISIDKIQRFNEKKPLGHPLSKTNSVTPQQSSK
jgi:hypothetical protein